jgi:hypothetical protein
MARRMKSGLGRREDWAPFTRVGGRVHRTRSVGFFEVCNCDGPAGWMPFSRKQTTSRRLVAVPNARRRVERPALRGVGQSRRSAQRQYDDYDRAPECEVYDDHQCERRRDECEGLRMSGISHVVSLLSGVCVCDLPIVSNGDGNATRECVGSVSTLLRKECRGAWNTLLRGRRDFRHFDDAWRIYFWAFQGGLYLRNRRRTSKFNLPRAYFVVGEAPERAPTRSSMCIRFDARLHSHLLHIVRRRARLDGGTRDVTAAWLAYSSKIEKTCRTGHDKRERVKCDKLARMACAVGARVGMSVGRATNDRRAIR